jgi:Uma2 family endonuclease
MPPDWSRRGTDMPARYSNEEVEMLDGALERLGGIPSSRIVYNPAPGTATEADLLALMRRTGRSYELIDGVLVEKTTGYREGGLAGRLLHLIATFLDDHDLGDIVGADATMRLLPKQVRVPDVAFTRWERMPNGQIPSEPIPDLSPDLAIEVLSKSNTPGEMKRKLKEYFLAGTSLVWYVDPVKRTVKVHTAPDKSRLFTEADTLDGAEVLPGFTLPVKRVFERLPKDEPKTPAKKRKQ